MSVVTNRQWRRANVPPLPQSEDVLTIVFLIMSRNKMDGMYVCDSDGDAC